MILLTGALLLLISGYSILLYTRLDRGNIFFDVALSWFLGCGYFCLSSFIYNFGFSIKTGPIASYVVILLPTVLLLIHKKRLYKTISSYKEPGNLLPTLPEGVDRIIFFSLIGISMIFILGTILHAVNAPVVSDDALRIRAYTPSITYRNLPLNPHTIKVFFKNGIWASYIPILFWHVNGSLEPFYINYYNSISFLSFLTIILFSPWLKEKPMQGAYSLLLVSTLPFFMLHSTTQMLDVPLTVSISLGFLFFVFYVREGGEKDLKTALVFFTIACFIKDKGEYAGLAGMSACLASVLFHKFWAKKRPSLSTLLLLAPIASYFLVKSLQTSTLEWVSAGRAVSLAKTYGKSVEPVKELANHAFDSKFDIFLYSTFTSGNQGLIFFILAITVIWNLKELLTSRKVLEFIFIFTLIMAIHFSMIVSNIPINILADWIHRYLMVPALLSAVWIPSLWFAEKTMQVPATTTNSTLE